MDEFTKAFFVCMLWSSTDLYTDKPLDEYHTIHDIYSDCLIKLMIECMDFQKANYNMISENLSGAGHDFWLTRNGHGAGFWDGDWPKEHGDILTEKCEEYRELTPYIGDDNMIHIDEF